MNDDLLSYYTVVKKSVSRIYEPQSIAVVLGAGRKAQEDCVLDSVVGDGVPVLRRRGGGGTVVLSTGQLVIALVMDVDSPFHNTKYAQNINEWIIRVLHTDSVKNIKRNGVSDLTLGNKKILGASIYRKRTLLFYQASLLVSNDISLFSRYLKYPSIVPEYRNNRNHEEFCTTLKKEGYRGSVMSLKHKLTNFFDRCNCWACV